MTVEEAKTILAKAVCPAGLLNHNMYLSWSRGEDRACLDGLFTADQLEAIAILMREGR